MYANFVSSNLRYLLSNSTESPSISSVMARVETEGGGSRKLSVAETLKQATAALETHRAWMKRRVSTSIAPLDCDVGSGRESAIIENSTKEVYPKTVNVGWALGSEKEVKQRGDNELKGAGAPTISSGVAGVPAPPPNVRAWQQGGELSSLTLLAGEKADYHAHESESSTSNNSPLAEVNHDLLESPNTPFPDHGQDYPDTGTPVDHFGATASNKLHFTFPSSLSQMKQSNFKIKKRQRMGKSSVVPMDESLTEVDEELNEDTLLSNRAKSPEVFIGESFQSKVSPIAPASTLVAWGSLSSLDNYIESLEASNKDIDQKPAHQETSRLTSSTPLGSLAKGKKEEKETTETASLGSKALNSRQQPLASPGLLQSSTINCTVHSTPSPMKAQDSFTDHSLLSPSKDESGESSFESSSNTEQFEALKAASSAKLIPVSQAPRTQRSSFSLHKQSKLVAAEADTKVYEAQFKKSSSLQSDDQLSSYEGSLGQHSLRNLTSTSIPDSVLQTVLPKQGEQSRKSGLTMLHVTKESDHSDGELMALHAGQQQSIPVENEKNQQLSPADSQPTISQTSLKASLQTSVVSLEEQDQQSLNKISLIRSKSFPAKEVGVNPQKGGDTSLKGDELQIQEVVSSGPGESERLFPSHSTPRLKSHALEVLNLPPLKTMIGKIWNIPW